MTAIPSAAGDAVLGTGGSIGVLVADDDPVQLRLLEKFMTRLGHAVVGAGDGESALAAMEKDPSIRLAILDWMMPGVDGLEVCRRIRSRVGHPYVYVILLTARDARSDVVEGLDAGADDYLTKPVSMAELDARVRAAERIIALQEKLLAAHERLRILAMHDPLTGVFNRGAIFDALTREMERARREDAPVAVLMADLDRFKEINDRFGHQVGDEALREVAARIRTAVRSHDSVGRYGGEEFLVVAPGLDGAAAAALAERIRRKVEASEVATSGPSVALTSSFGVVSVPVGARVEVKDVVAAADAALYRAKREGRNRTTLGELLQG